MSTPTQAPDQQENPASFGARLKHEREQRRITLEQISQSTKIGTRFLQALEEDHFQQLPGGIFNKGFVRAYARFIGIDEEQALADYLAATAPTQQKAEPAEPPAILELPPETGRERSANLPWGLLATVLLLAAFVLSVWGFYSWVTSPRARELLHTPQAKAPTVVTEPAQPPPEPQVSSGTSRPSAPPATAKQTTTTGSTATVSPETTAAATHDLVLKITAREDAWLSTTVDGEVTEEQTLAASTEKTIRAHSQILIKTGNIGGLDFEFKGEPLPVQGNEGEVETLIFDANGWHVVHKPASVPEPEPQP